MRYFQPFLKNVPLLAGQASGHFNPTSEQVFGALVGFFENLQEPHEGEQRFNFVSPVYFFDDKHSYSDMVSYDTPEFENKDEHPNLKCFELTLTDNHPGGGQSSFYVYVDTKDDTVFYCFRDCMRYGEELRVFKGFENPLEIQRGELNSVVMGILNQMGEFLPEFGNVLKKLKTLAFKLSAASLGSQAAAPQTP